MNGDFYGVPWKKSHGYGHHQKRRVYWIIRLRNTKEADFLLFQNFNTISHHITFSNAWIQYYFTYSLDWMYLMKPKGTTSFWTAVTEFLTILRCFIAFLLSHYWTIGTVWLLNFLTTKDRVMVTRLLKHWHTWQICQVTKQKMKLVSIARVNQRVSLCWG